MLSSRREKGPRNKVTDTLEGCNQSPKPNEDNHPKPRTGVSAMRKDIGTGKQRRVPGPQPSPRLSYRRYYGECESAAPRRRRKAGHRQLLAQPVPPAQRRAAVCSERAQSGLRIMTAPGRKAQRGWHSRHRLRRTGNARYFPGQRRRQLRDPLLSGHWTLPDRSVRPQPPRPIGLGRIAGYR
jgi:hypothetical protein